MEILSLLRRVFCSFTWRGGGRLVPLRSLANLCPVFTSAGQMGPRCSPDERRGVASAKFVDQR